MSQIPIGWLMEGLYLYPLLLKVMIDGIPKRSIFTNRTIWGWFSKQGLGLMSQVLGIGESHHQNSQPYLLEMKYLPNFVGVKKLEHQSQPPFKGKYPIYKRMTNRGSPHDEVETSRCQHWGSWRRSKKSHKFALRKRGFWSWFFSKKNWISWMIRKATTMHLRACWPCLMQKTRLIFVDVTAIWGVIAYYPQIRVYAIS